MQEQIHHIFIDEIVYCLYGPCMKKTTYDFMICFYDPSLYCIFNVVS